MENIKISGKDLFLGDEKIGFWQRRSADGNPAITLFSSFYGKSNLNEEDMHNVGRRTHQQLYAGTDEFWAIKGIGYYDIELTKEAQPEDTRDLIDRQSLNKIDDGEAALTVWVFANDLVKNAVVYAEEKKLRIAQGIPEPGRPDKRSVWQRLQDWALKT